MALCDLALFGGGRLFAIVTTNVLLHRSIQVPLGDNTSRTVLVRGPMPLNKVSSREADLEGIIQVAYLEMAEAFVGYFAVTYIGRIAGEHWGTFGMFVMMGFVDLIWEGAYALKWTPETYGYALVDDTGGQPSRAFAIFRRGITDGLYYTAVLLVWKSSYVPKEGFFGDTTGQMLWFARNFVHRLLRRGTWRKVVDLKQSIFPDDRKKLVTYRSNEYHSVYVKVDVNGEVQGAFVWDWQKGTREIDLGKLLARVERAAKSKISWEDELEREKSVFLQRYVLTHSVNEPLNSEVSSSAASREEEKKGIEPDGKE